MNVNAPVCMVRVRAERLAQAMQLGEWTIEDEDALSAYVTTLRCYATAGGGGV